ncbi:zf-HC2 domain-containing protein [Auraticoccus cholistanensis]|uniref:zf-HC2 domain-containing protein n=1 Tax=Auraticoccus cholistanensis TaxID=2656650 RepID=UPI0018D20DA1|nr:zf-HC2 domain-containing protein [Auraticoccus cholistanensis]
MPATPASRPCGTQPETLSALVDGALGDAERERLLVHLADCADCRAEAEELRRVRDLLAGTGRTEPVAPDDLSRRLVDIAGADATTPLWTRPFDPVRDGVGALPLSYQVRRRRLGRVGLLATVLLLAFTTVGWTAAPEAGAPVGDPGPRAEDFFGSALGQLPLATEGMAALVLSGTTGIDQLRGRGAPSSAGAGVVRDHPITADEALVVLRSSAVAGAMLPRSGTQQVQVRVGGETVRAWVDVVVQPGQSTQVSVVSGSGERLAAGSLAVAEAPTSVELLGATHTLRGYLQADTVAGRETTVVEALDDGTPVARWWVDAASGLLLRTERYDADGRASAVAGFETVEIGTDTFSARLGPRLATFSGSGPVALSEAPRLSAQGWSCAEELAGLPLVQLRTTSDGALHSAYSDGVHTVAVSQQRGVLTGAPAGSSWDPALAAWRSTDSLPAQLVWQSGDRVITVTTDAADGTVWSAVAQLPHEEPEDRTPVDRVLEGWQRVGSLVLQR